MSESMTAETSRAAEIAAALDERVSLGISNAEAEADRLARAAARDGRSGNYLSNLRIVYVDAMRTISENAARLLAAIDGEAAGQNSQMLDETLRNAGDRFTEAYRRRGSDIAVDTYMVDLVERLASELRNELIGIVVGTVRNLRLGVVGTDPLREISRQALQIDARGGNANVMVGSPGGSIAIGRDQIASTGIDAAALVDALETAFDRVQQADMAPEPKIDLLDQLEHARRLALSDDRDEGLLRRTVARVLSPLKAIGCGVISDRLAAALGAG